VTLSRTLAFLRRYRGAALALGASAALHAAILVATAPRSDAGDAPAAVGYTASLDIATPRAEGTPAALPASTPLRTPARAAHARRAPAPIPAEVFEPLASLPPGPAIPALATVPEILAQAEAAPEPEKLALAQPAVPVPALEPEKFPVAALPASISISYQLTSAFADGHAVYTWNREGDNYTITGEAEAVGFFTLFLEGRILQESRGTVTGTGLRPERFVERKPNAPPEGLDFDWSAGEVTMDRNAQLKKTPLVDNTVDWLSMIFQLAHQPPRGESMDLRVFTQRKFYQFHLMVLGEEEIEIPLGRVRAQHLRHIDAKDPSEVVDVWLGVKQHYLPVKLRYPVARNRLVVEQLATKVTSR
jgi:hypothetical protein